MRIIKLIIIYIFWSLSFTSLGFGEEETVQSKIRMIERTMMIDGDYEGALSKLNTMSGDSRGKGRIPIDIALAHYGLMEYSRALEKLKTSSVLDTDKNIKDIRLYLISKIEANETLLNTIEKAKNSLSENGEKNKDYLNKRIMTGHLVMLNKLMGEKYYYPAMVIPHVVWLKNNASDVPGIYELSGNVYYSAMFYSQAAEDYKKAVLEDQGNIRLYQTAGDCYTALGDFDNAEGNYEKAIELYREKGVKENDSKVSRLKQLKHALPKKYKDIADLIKREQFNEAEEIGRKRISLNPGDYIAITQLGQIYWQRQKRRDAVRLFHKAAKIAPDYPFAHLYLGKAYLFEQNTEKAFSEFCIFKKNMELIPQMDKETIDSYVANLHYIAYMYSTLKQYQNMITECKRIIKIKPDDQRAHYNLAVCYYKYFGNLEYAYRELKTIIELDSTSQLADMARYFMDYIRRNPDDRIIADFSFLYENY